MKSLIIGNDGGDEQLFRELQLSNLIKLFDSFNRIDLTENLWDRGWASILSGKEGTDIRAFYTKPDEFFFEGKGKLIQENNATISSLSLVNRDMFKRLKGSKPLFFTYDHVTKIDSPNPNLTMAYHFLKNQLSK